MKRVVKGNDHVNYFNRNELLSEEHYEYNEDDRYEQSTVNDNRESYRTMQFLSEENERLAEKVQILESEISVLHHVQRNNENESRKSATNCETMMIRNELFQCNYSMKEEETVKKELKSKKIISRQTEESLLSSIFLSCHETMWRLENRNLFDSLNKTQCRIFKEETNRKIFDEVTKVLQKMEFGLEKHKLCDELDEHQSELRKDLGDKDKSFYRLKLFM